MRALVLLVLVACSTVPSVSASDAGTDAAPGFTRIEPHKTVFHPNVFELKARGLLP